MPRREALIVAINDYGDERNNLNSCIADAHAMQEILMTQYGLGAVPGLQARTAAGSRSRARIFR